MIRFRSLAVIAAVLLGIGSAVAQQRCEGTFCDLYYRGSAPEQPVAAQPGAPTPLTVPTMPAAGNFISNMFSRSDAQAQAAGTQAAAAPAGSGESSGFFHMGGGGLMGQNRGTDCGGTLCDLFHGHSSEAENDASVSQSVNGVPVSRLSSERASAAPAARPAAAAPAEVAEQQPAPRRIAVRAEPKPPACALKASDPWSCYRR